MARRFTQSALAYRMCKNRQNTLNIERHERGKQHNVYPARGRAHFVFLTIQNLVSVRESSSPETYSVNVRKNTTVEKDQLHNVNVEFKHACMSLAYMESGPSPPILFRSALVLNITVEQPQFQLCVDASINVSVRATTRSTHCFSYPFSDSPGI
jgi:hypothetical protein